MRRGHTLVEVLVAASIMVLLSALSWGGLRAAMPRLSDKEEAARLVQFFSSLRSQAIFREETITITSDGRVVTARDAAGMSIFSFVPLRFERAEFGGRRAFMLFDGACIGENGPFSLTLTGHGRTLVCAADGVYGPITAAVS